MNPSEILHIHTELSAPRWNPDLTELDIVKLIVKHIKPYLAVNSVEE